MDALCPTRAARRADLEAVARIERASFVDPWPLDAFLVYLDDCFLVAGAGDAVLGFLVARRAADEAEILDLAVASGDRNRGVGRALLTAAIERLRREGARRAFLEVRRSNAAARRLYETCGFRVVGSRPGYYDEPLEDALVLALGLEGAPA